jgi:hypothetical protein
MESCYIIVVCVCVCVCGKSWCCLEKTAQLETLHIVTYVLHFLERLGGMSVTKWSPNWLYFSFHDVILYGLRTEQNYVSFLRSRQSYLYCTLLLTLVWSWTHQDWNTLSVMPFYHHHFVSVRCHSILFVEPPSLPCAQFSPFSLAVCARYVCSSLSKA